MGAAFIAKFLPAGTTVYISRPTWGNHKNICADAGVAWKEYRCVGVDGCGVLFSYEGCSGLLRLELRKQASGPNCP